MREGNDEAGIPGAGRRVSSFVQGLSLKHKLIAIIMLTCLASLTLVGGVFMAWEWTTLRHTVIRDLSAHAQILADNCKASITFHDPADAGACLRTISAIPSVLGVCVYTSDGELFAAYLQEGTTVVPLPPKKPRNGYRYEGDSLVLTRLVLLDGEPIGTVCLRGSLAPMRLRLQRSILVILCFVILSSLAAYLISSRLQRIISAPILQLAGVARRVSEQKEYTVRVEPAGPDEVGLLIQAFNEMLGQIERRDAALVEANEQLEARVDERTVAPTRD
jgi:HAMP domain-containing protein